jgi:hypothetical protein
MEELIMTTENTTRAQALATRLEETTDTLIAQVEPCSEAQWRASAPNEDCSVGTMVHHIAVQAPIVAGWGAQVGRGEIPSVTMEIVHAETPRMRLHMPVQTRPRRSLCCGLTQRLRRISCAG